MILSTGRVNTATPTSWRRCSAQRCLPPPRTTTEEEKDAAGVCGGEESWRWVGTRFWSEHEPR